MNSYSLTDCKHSFMKLEIENSIFHDDFGILA